MHLAIAIDVRLHDFPIVDAGVARLAGISQHDAFVEIGQVDVQRFARDTRCIQLDGAHAAIHRRIVILRARGHANDLGFNVL